MKSDYVVDPFCLSHTKQFQMEKRKVHAIITILKILIKEYVKFRSIKTITCSQFDMECVCTVRIWAQRNEHYFSKARRKLL